MSGWFSGLAGGWHEPSAKAKAEATKVKAEAQKAQEEAQKALEDAEKVKAKAKKEADQRVANVANQLTEERTKTKDLAEELRKAQEQANDLPRGWHSTKTQPKEQITTVGASSRSEGLTFCIVWYNNTIQLQRRRKMARQLDVMVVRIPPEVKKEFDKKAKEFDLSMSQIARRLVEDWLKKDPQKPAI